MSEHRLTQHTYRGRTWLLMGREPYIRKDGTAAELLRWRTSCAACESPVEIRTPVVYESSKAFGAMHCAAHKLSRAHVTQLRDAAKAAKRAA